MDEVKRNLRYADSLLGDLALDQIDREILNRLKQQKLNTGVAPATVNRLLASIRAILNTAHRDWGWIDAAPTLRLLSEPQRRVRWLTREDAENLLVALPEHLAAMMRFTLATGLREMNVVKLEWHQVDLERRMAWMHADQTKGQGALAVPLNAEAVCVLHE